jgi:hypothetical protein
VTNGNNTFADGTLFLHDSANGGTTCTSESASSNDNFNVSGCDVLFNFANITPGTVATADLALTNAGTIDSSGIKFFAPSACVSTIQTIAALHTTVAGSTTPGNLVLEGLTQTLVKDTVISLTDAGHNEVDFTVTATTQSAGSDPSDLTTVPVSGATSTDAITAGAKLTLKTPFTESPQTVCTAANVTIQEVTDNAYGTPVAATCAYPADGSAVCPSTVTNSTATLSSLPTGSVNATSLTLKSGAGDSNTNALLSAGGGTRYFVISVEVPATVGNPLQNEEATVGLTWELDQV